MDLKFKIDKDIILYNSLIKNDKTKGWNNLQKKLWKDDEVAYNYLWGNFYLYFAKGKTDNVSEKIQDFLDTVGNTQEFNEILKNTEKYKDRIEQEWKTKKDLIIQELERILKIKLPNVSFDVFLTSPLSRAGIYLGDRKIVFGHSEDWKNYTLVYLMHECLHEIIGEGKIEHAVIELATDNELRIRLNKGGHYFEENGKDIGHKWLRSLEKSILENWKKYLVTKSVNVFDFIENQKSIQRK